jgi:fatty-acyl-CoA synthase
MTPGPSRPPGDLNWILDTVDGQIPTADRTATAMSIEGLESWTYAELRAARDRYALGLLALGIERGDRVGLLLSNCLEYMALHFALLRIGAIAVRLNFRLTGAELRYVLEDSGATCLFLHATYAERIEAIRDEVPVGTYVVVQDGDAPVPDWALDAAALSGEAGDRLPEELPGPDDPVMLMYTSGTTGFPKAAVWLSSTCVSCATMQATKWGYDEGTVVLTTGPLYHAGSLEHMVLPALLRRGRAVCMSSGGFTAERMVAAIEREGVTDLALSPFMLYELVRMDDLARRLATLRRVVCGGDSIMSWAIAAFRTQLPHVGLIQGYGLTEATSIMTLDPADLEAHPDSVGKPMPLHQARVVREDGTATAPGEVGEIHLHGPAVCAGYWGRPEATAEVFADGWLHTGDLGRVSADGFLTITGRKKDMYRSGGENVYPAEVEGILTQHPSIADAAVVGVPDPRFLEVGCAVLVASSEPVDAGELTAWCRDRLAGFKCPKHVVWIDELPRTASGKVIKHVLRDRYRELGRTPTPTPGVP